MIRFVLLVLVLALVACSNPAPVAPHPAGKANCSLCGFLGDDRYTAAEGQGTHESPDSTSATTTEADSTQADAATEADSTQADAATEADSTQAEATAEADSTQAEATSSSDSELESFFGDDRYNRCRPVFRRRQSRAGGAGGAGPTTRLPYTRGHRFSDRAFG